MLIGDKYITSNAGGKVSNANHIKYDKDSCPKNLQFEREFYITEMMELLKKGNFKFPFKGSSYESMTWLLNHITNFDIKPITRQGEPNISYVKSGPTDGAMALLNAYLGYRYLVTKGFTNAGLNLTFKEEKVPIIIRKYFKNVIIGYLYMKFAKLLNLKFKISNFYITASIKSDLIDKFPTLKSDIEKLSDSIDTKYLKYATNLLNTISVSETIELIKKFEKYKGKLTNKDIYSYSLQDLQSKLNELSSTHKTRSEKNEIKYTGANTVFEDEQCIVVYVTTIGSACFYGKGTRWCVAMKNPDKNLFNNYETNNESIFFILRKDLDQSNPNYKIGISYPDIKKLTQDNPPKFYNARDEKIQYTDITDLINFDTILSLTDDAVINKVPSKLSKIKQKIITSQLSTIKIDDLLALNIQNINYPIAMFQKLTQDQFDFLVSKNLLSSLAQNKFLTNDQFFTLYKPNKEIIMSLIINPELPLEIKNDIINFIKTDCDYKKEIINHINIYGNKIIKQIVNSI